MRADSDQAEIDAHIDYWNVEGESMAQYDAWRLSPQPYDFTGASYLEEFTKLLREKTSLMERFARRVECSRETDVEFEEFSLEPDQKNLSFMLEIDREIFEEGDDFLHRDQSFLDDLRKIETLALGEVLAETSIRHGCLEFWPRLREMGPTPQMVREARGWWLLANIDMEPKYDFYSSQLEDTIAEFDPEVEKIVAEGRFAVEAMGSGNGGWAIFSTMQGMSSLTKREMLSAYLRRDKLGVERIYDRVASGAEAKARKGNHSLFLRGRVQRVEGPREPDTYCDTSFLRFASEWGEVTARESSSKASSMASKGVARAVNHRGRSRSRCSRGHTRRRTAGSRRSSSSDDGGGGSDPPSPPLVESCDNPRSPTASASSLLRTRLLIALWAGLDGHAAAGSRW